MNMDEISSIASEAVIEARKRPYGNPLFPPSIYYSFYKVLAAAKKPKLSVVLGVCGGGDCLHLCLGNPEGIVVGVDNAWDHPEQIDHIKATCRGFRFMLDDSILSAPKIFSLFGEIDVLFIDTVHLLENTLQEYSAYLPYLADGAVVCFDDIFRPGMEEAWDTIPGPKQRFDFLHDGSPGVGGGFGVHIHSKETVIPPVGYELGN